MSNEKHHISSSKSDETHDVGVTERELRIEGLAVGGRGVGRVEGRVWLVSGAVPGDQVIARSSRVRGRRLPSIVQLLNRWQRREYETSSAGSRYVALMARRSTHRAPSIERRKQ